MEELASSEEKNSTIKFAFFYFDICNEAPMSTQ